MKQRELPMKKFWNFLADMKVRKYLPDSRHVHELKTTLLRQFNISLFSSRHLDRSILLEETGSPAIFKLTIYCFFAFTIFFLVWSSLMRIDEVSIATGEIIPLGKTHKIQHLEGGIVARILVKDGEEVQKDQPLVEMDTSKIASQLNEARTHQLALSARVKRLEAFLKNRNLEPGAGPLTHDTWDDGQIEILAKSFASLDAARKIIQHQIGQLDDEMAGLDLNLANVDVQLEKMKKDLKRIKDDGERSATMLKKEKALMQEEIDIREGLVDQGLNSNIKFLILQREFYQLEKEQLEKVDAFLTKVSQYETQIADLETQKKNLPLEISKRKKRILELNNTLAEKESSILEKSYIQLDELREQLKQANENVVRNADSLTKAHIQSPTRGFVNSLKIHSSGVVVAAGELLMEIVPKDTPLVAEIRISNLDIGHVKAGQDVVLKLTTYDFSRYGSLKGRLLNLSANSYTSEKEEPYFLGSVELNQFYLDPMEKKNPLLPGMTLRAEVITGNKSIMEYLIKPIYKNTKQALKER